MEKIKIKNRSRLISFYQFLLIFQAFLFFSAVSAHACTPAISITSPQNNTTYVWPPSGVNGSVNVTIGLGDCSVVNIRELMYYMNGDLICDYFSGNPSFLSCPITGLGVGDYTFSVRGVQQTVTIHVVAPSPTCNLTIDSNSYNTPASIVMTATASANGYGYISQVQFFGDGNLLTTSEYPPYTFTWTGVSAGIHTLQAIATNAKSGATATSTISNLPVYTPPNFIAYNNQCRLKL